MYHFIKIKRFGTISCWYFVPKTEEEILEHWETNQELENCYKQVFKDSWEGDYIEWAALIGAMKGYEASGEFETRAVYWFDN